MCRISAQVPFCLYLPSSVLIFIPWRGQPHSRSEPPLNFSRFAYSFIPPLRAIHSPRLPETVTFSIALHHLFPPSALYCSPERLTPCGHNPTPSGAQPIPAAPARRSATCPSRSAPCAFATSAACDRLLLSITHFPVALLLHPALPCAFPIGADKDTLLSHHRCAVRNPHPLLLPASTRCPGSAGFSAVLCANRCSYPLIVQPDFVIRRARCAYSGWSHGRCAESFHPGDMACPLPSSNAMLTSVPASSAGADRKYLPHRGVTAVPTGSRNPASTYPGQSPCSLDSARLCRYERRHHLPWCWSPAPGVSLPSQACG